MNGAAAYKIKACLYYEGNWQRSSKCVVLTRKVVSVDIKGEAWQLWGKHSPMNNVVCSLIFPVDAPVVAYCSLMMCD